MTSAKAAQVSVARHAMATRFEIVLHGREAVRLRAAAEEALDEVERIENQLSPYRPASAVAHLNARAAREPVRVDPALFRLLEQARSLCQQTDGAFDITIGPLMECWGFRGERGDVPSAQTLKAARASVGMHLVELDPDRFTVRFRHPGVRLDLGALGKGYAIERAAQLLRDAGIANALLHGGTSSVCALGHPPDAAAWNVAVEHLGKKPDDPAVLLAVIPLVDESLSVSAVWGKSFQSAGQTYGHVLDPRTGQPASRATLATVVLPSATETDAFSTALLTVGCRGHDRLAALRPAMRTLVVEPGRNPASFRVKAQGIKVRRSGTGMIRLNNHE